MNRFSYAGLLVALAALALAHYLGGGELSALFNLHALLIVLGGSLGAVMLQTPGKIFLDSFSSLRQAFRAADYPFAKRKQQLLEWAKLVRRDGYLALERDSLKSEDPYTQDALRFLIDGADAERLHRSFNQRIDLQQELKERHAEVHEAMGGYCPTLGILGAVLGLVQAMSFLNSPELLGQGIAVAFVATIYGVGFANLWFLPVANLIRNRAAEEALFQEMTLNGLVGISQGLSVGELERELQHYILVSGDA